MNASINKKEIKGASAMEQEHHRGRYKRLVTANANGSKK
jgi:hypothetical protein